MKRAAWAVRAETTRGRLHPEPDGGPRSPFQRDRDRIIHSSAFRKLQYKTQVFINHEGDFYRTRLTHSIEVAQIARSIARSLELDEDLTEALALAHDLGHPPFGHAGEEALATAMKPFGGFDHNAQSLRVVTLLESRYAGWDGLNLTWEALEGLAKHNGPLRHPPPYVAEYNARHKLDLDTHAAAEAQVAALADDVAYHSHDLDDGLRARLFAIEDLGHLPIVGEALGEARRASLDMPPVRLRHETIRRVIKEFLFARMYHHWRQQRMHTKARRLTGQLFDQFHASPGLLPDDWRARAGEAPLTPRAAAVVMDYIAGMTDRYAMDEHARLTDLSVSG